MIKANRDPGTGLQHHHGNHQVAGQQYPGAVPQQRTQCGEFSRCHVQRNKTHRGIRQAEPVDDSQKADDRHTQRIQPQSFRSQNVRQVNLEDVTKNRCEDCSRENNPGLPRNAAHL